jgi:hypothetical protein
MSPRGPGSAPRPPAVSTTIDDLQTLITSYHPVIVLDTPEEPRADRVIAAAADGLRLPLFEWSITRGLRRAPAGHMVHGTSDLVAALKHVDTLTIEAVFHFSDVAPHLDAPAVSRALRDVARRFSRTRSAMVLTGLTSPLPAAVEAHAVHVVLNLPGEDDLDRLVTTVVTTLRRHRNVDVSLSPEARRSLVRALSGLTLDQARRAVAQVIVRQGRLSGEDVRQILDLKAEMIRESGVVEYVPLDRTIEIGGFGRLEAWLDRARVGFSGEARALNLTPPRGVLFVGVQGCGKSLAAKAVASRWDLPLLRLDAGRLLDKFVGESERNFRRAVTQAESMAPAVLWIDEIEKGFVPAGAGEADGGLSLRLFGAFLTWLQERTGDVFIVATANDLSRVPPELLRKGRFDEIFFVDLPDGPARRRILEIHLGGRKQESTTFDLDALCAATEGFSGAELEQVVIAGLYRALHAKRALDTPLLLEEIRETSPLSVSRREDLEQLRAFARGRFVGVR